MTAIVVTDPAHFFIQTAQRGIYLKGLPREHVVIVCPGYSQQWRLDMDQTPQVLKQQES